jgi:hypothetical protein
MQDTGVKVPPEIQVTILLYYRERMEGEEEMRKQEGKKDGHYLPQFFIHKPPTQWVPGPVSPEV